MIKQWHTKTKLDREKNFVEFYSISYTQKNMKRKNKKIFYNDENEASKIYKLIIIRLIKYIKASTKRLEDIEGLKVLILSNN